MKECPTILTPNTRRLIKFTNKLEEIGVPSELIKFYKEQEPFYYLDLVDESVIKFS